MYIADRFSPKKWGILDSSAPMSKIKMDVFVAEVGFNVAELFTKLNTIAMYFAHVFFACTMVFAM